MDRNEAALAKNYDTDDAEETEIFEREEYEKFFPVDREAMLRIWDGPFWSTYFLILAATGARPGQVSALRWEDWYTDIEGLWSYRSVNHLNGELKELKTAKKGVKGIPLLLTSRANYELAQWREITDYSEDEDLIFRWEGKTRFTLQLATILKHLRYSAGRAGVEIRGRTTYSWRHSYTTDMLEFLDEGTAQELVGHRKGSKITKKHYDHRKAEAQIRAVRDRAQFAVERRFA